MQQTSSSSSPPPPQQPPLSITILLQRRVEGRCGSSPYKFSYCLARKRSQRLERQLYPRIQNTTNQTVLSLDACKDGRYLLTGSKQGLLCIYDLSPWGQSPKYLPPHSKQAGAGAGASASQEESSPPRSTHRPIQQALAAQRVVVSCQWYPADTGMFFSASRSGVVQCWDTNEMIPVSEVKPFQFGSRLSSLSAIAGRGRRSLSTTTTTLTTTTTTLSCMKVYPNDGLTLATASSTCSVIKLIDVRSGSSSHTLTGHGHGGVVDLAWSTACPFVLASGGTDSCILLWDIRKAGGLSRITALDMEERQQIPPIVCDAYQADYAHLRRQRRQQPATTTTRRATITLRPNHPNFKCNNKQRSGIVRTSPNNYYGTTTTTTNNNNRLSSDTTMPLAHRGGCVGLEFSPNGHYLVSAGGNGDLTVWDLRNKGAACPIPRRFVSAASNGQFGGGRSAAAAAAVAGAATGKPVDPRFLGRVPLVLEQEGNGDSTRIWTQRGAHLYAYSMHQGGSPEIVLKGHMGHVTAISKIGSTGQLVSAADDSLLLLWGPTGFSSSEAVQTRRQGKRRQLNDRDDW